MFEKNVYQARRQKLKQQVVKGLILLLGNEESSMNYKDNLYHFRQDSSFLYFFGLDKPGLSGIIDIDNDREVIFGNELTIDEIVWMGPQPSLAEQAAQVGITAVQPSSALISSLHGTRTGKQDIHFLPPYRPENTLKLSTWLGIAPGAIREHASLTLIKAVVAQRSIKSPEEVREIEEAVNITADMHLAAIKGAKEGMTEAQLAGVLH